MISSSTSHHMVSKKSFQLLMASGRTPFFAVVPIISDGDCSHPVTWGNEKKN